MLNVLFSCQKNEIAIDTEIYLRNREVTLHSLDSYRIEAQSNIEPISFTVHDSYVAWVSPYGGDVMANKVGNTTVTLYNGYDRKIFKIFVVPEYSIYEEPHFEYGATKDKIKTIEKRTLIFESDSLLTFQGENTNTSHIEYFFADGQSLYSANVYLFKNQYVSNTIVSFLSERYEFDGGNHHTYLWYDRDLIHYFILKSTKDYLIVSYYYNS